MTLTKPQKVGFAGCFLAIIGVSLLTSSTPSHSRSTVALMGLVPSVVALFVTYKFIPPRKVGKIVNTLLGLPVVFVGIAGGHDFGNPVAGAVVIIGAVLWIVASYPKLLQKVIEQKPPDT
jgi:peptidoglycan/LPS O-acetylase OafA/YrhL